jgi:hypothetical protein
LWQIKKYKNLVMTTSTIRLKLQDYIQTVEDKKVKAIYTMFETEIEEASNHWQDESFVVEMKKRSKDIEKGFVKEKNWEDVKAKLLAKVK